MIIIVFAVVVVFIVTSTLLSIITVFLNFCLHKFSTTFLKKLI